MQQFLISEANIMWASGIQEYFSMKTCYLQYNQH